MNQCLTFDQLCKIIDEHHIPHDVMLLSDSGWECSHTEMSRAYYNKAENVIVFSQDAGHGDCTSCSHQYISDNSWEVIY